MRIAAKNKYGSKSETNKALEPLYGYNLFNEIEEVAAESTIAPLPLDALATLHNQSKKKKSRKPSQSQEMEIVDIFHDLDESERVGFIYCGEKIREEICFQPAKYYIKKHHYKIYKKDWEDGSTEFISAKGFEPLIEKSYLSSQLAAHIISDKYAKGLPLYRIEQDMYANDVAISRQTLANWCMRLSEDYFSFLVSRMKFDLLLKDIIHSDDTTTRVLHHQDGSENKNSAMWVYRSSKYDVPILIYDYQPDRKQERPEEFLKGYCGYLSTDGTHAYNSLESVTRIGCLAHAKRKFTDALTAYGKNNTSESKKLLVEIIRKINYIFHLDKKLNFCTLEEKQEARISQIKPLFDGLKETLVSLQGRILEASSFGKAINYTLNQFPILENVFLDPRLELSNNAAERTIKPFVMGRKAWLFSNTTRGAQCSATLYSIVQTAKENHLKVVPYLAYVLEEMRGKSISNDSQFDYLLPYSKTLPDSLKLKIKQE